MKIIVAVLFFVLFLFIIPKNILAETGKPGLNLTPSPTVVSIDYPLPYPGILPDHPLYFLKVIRDRLLGWFIKDPVKKIEFNLLMSDKRLKMGEVLIENGKSELAISTISKGEKYFMEAVLLLWGNRTRKDDVMGSLREKLYTAVLKHKEDIGNLAKKDLAKKDEWQTVLSITADNEAKLLNLK